MLEKYTLEPLQGSRAVINEAYRAEESILVKRLIEEASISQNQVQAIQLSAKQLVEKIRSARRNSTGLDSFLQEYGLSSSEGIALMCLAEALLRVPDKATIDNLIRDKLLSSDWKAHYGQSDSFFVNATTWALMLTGKVLEPEKAVSSVSKALFKLLNSSGEVLIRKAVDKAMRIMSKQFVMGRNIGEALVRAQKKEAKGFRYSYDMLGEAALTAKDAERYLLAYQKAIEAIGKSVDAEKNLYQRPGISIKLSALHPRYQEAQRQRVWEELSPRLLLLCQEAKKYDIALTIDAEESERLDISLDVIERVLQDKSLHGWQGFGIAVQSYQKRAFFLLDWVVELAKKAGKRIMVRLIKGAYWDSEIKKTQMQGLKEYPVFTRKAFTDVSFQACVKKILAHTSYIYPQFATHNAYSVALILSLVGSYRDFEFQCLHGMGTELYEEIVPAAKFGIPCRIYAPVGTHEDLLPYLVRRLLENGANSSFVNRIVDEKAPIQALIEDPLAKARSMLHKMHQNIPLPSAIFLPQRQNSQGLDFTDRAVLVDLQAYYAKKEWIPLEAKPLLGGKREGGEVQKNVFSPENTQVCIGRVTDASLEDVDWALKEAQDAFVNWSKLTVEARAQPILAYADLLEQHREDLMEILSLEAGKTFLDAQGEIREAIDFCRYYAHLGTELMGTPLSLQGYTGESNTVSLQGRGPILCISPWNFPLAIFTGQIVASLITGNCVLAKPAEQTPLIAHYAVNLLYKAGIPREVLQLLPGTGEHIGAALVADKRIKGVLFTGSTQTANLIHQTLATRGGEIIPLIAETGGQNAMIVDSSALLEQVVSDVVVSAFGSAGQRCSALRVLYVQKEVYPRMIELLQGVMAELCVGSPRFLHTDIGPVIDKEALKMLQRHVAHMQEKHTILYQCALPKETSTGLFMPPTAIVIGSMRDLEKEVFGPILHVISYEGSELDKVIEEINDTQYGLTLGIHSRINQKVQYIQERVHVGNCYVNRNIIGAVVGLQPFGGQGLSGTGPKAGGPYYLQRLCHEKTLTIDTTAAGGNASLMSIPENL